MKKRKLLRFLVFVLLFLLVKTETTLGQESKFRSPKEKEVQISDSLKTLRLADSIRNSLPDTIPITYYFQGDEQKIYNYSDTSLNRLFHQYDPIRRQTFGGLNLGNTGSPTMPIFLNAFRKSGIDWGFHQFDIYNNTVDNLPFYGLGRPLTDTYFSFKGQSNSVFRANFSRQFQDGFQFSLKYLKINQLGQFLSQKAVISSLATGVQYKHPKGRYRFYLSMSSNNSRVSDNGGLTTDTLFFTEGFKRPSTQPIRLTTAQTHQLSRKYQFFHFYKMGNFQNGNHFEWRHKSWYEKGFYKYFDNHEPLDSIYYGDFLTDGRGVRQYFSGHELGTEIALSFLGRTKDSLVFEWLPTPGLKVVSYEVNQEPVVKNETHVSLTGKWNVLLNKTFRLAAKADLGLVGYSGDYLLNGQLHINTGRIGEWTLFADFQSVTPSLLSQKSFVTQTIVWNNTFDKEFLNRLGGKYELPQYDFSFSSHFSLLTNHIYYGLDGAPRQSSRTIPVLQISATKGVRVKGFHLESDILYQKSGEDFIRRPNIYLEEQLYWEGDLFSKALRLKTGVDYRFFSSWQPYAYSPVFGQFVLQNDFEMGNMSSFDVFMDFKVSTFRFFAKMENLQYYWDKRVFYLTADYPQFKPAFRMGVAWRFRD